LKERGAKFKQESARVVKLTSLPNKAVNTTSAALPKVLCPDTEAEEEGVFSKGV
jgi:hypothetical protein